MDGIMDIYYGALDAYHLVAPWIPFQFQATVQSLIAQTWTVVHALLTNPSDFPSMIPTILSLFATFLSVYWTLYTVYSTARSGLRWFIFLTKWGSIFAVVLGVVGLVNLNGPIEEVTVARAVLSGMHTAADWVGFDTFAPQPPSSPSGPRKPWEKFLKTDGPSSNTRSKRTQRGSRAGGAGSGGSGSLGDTLSWLNKLREDFQKGGDDDGTMGGNTFTFEREIRKIWENNKDGWHSADDFLNAFKLKTPQTESEGAQAAESGDGQPYSEGTKSR